MTNVYPYDLDCPFGRGLGGVRKSARSLPEMSAYNFGKEETLLHRPAGQGNAAGRIVGTWPVAWTHTSQTAQLQIKAKYCCGETTVTSEGIH